MSMFQRRGHRCEEELTSATLVALGCHAALKRPYSRRLCHVSNSEKTVSQNTSADDVMEEDFFYIVHFTVFIVYSAAAGSV